jgi:hypothetical protein
MSSPQTNFENNNRMSELTKNINDIFGYILLYSVIIFTTISALFGGIVIYPIYGVIYIFNKIRSAAQNEIVVEENEITVVKKPIIDENWCNISVKNIINFENDVTEEDEVEEEIEEDEVEEDEVVGEEEIGEDEVEEDEVEEEEIEEEENEVVEEEDEEVEEEEIEEEEVEEDEEEEEEVEEDVVVEEVAV